MSKERSWGKNRTHEARAHPEEGAELLLADAWRDAPDLDPALLEGHCGRVHHRGDVGVDEVGVDAPAQRGVQRRNSADAWRQRRATCALQRRFR